MISLQDAVDELYRVAVRENKPQSPNRLAKLADMCVEQLGQRNIQDVAKECDIRGAGRSKKWDVAWPDNGKTRLGISLKSILKNIPGSVPNRLDDLMGEVANVQLWSPEIVTGYIVVFDSAASEPRQDGGRWIDFFHTAVDQLSGRAAPAWSIGMVEASAIVEVDFSQRAHIVSRPRMQDFFDTLARCVRDRNPDMFPGSQAAP